MTITLRPHQIAAVDAVEEAFRAGINRPLVDMCVAAGKSLTFAELARREISRGGRVIIGAHRSELVSQNAGACRSLGLQCGINSSMLNERTWRAPVISCQVQSVFRHAQSFGPVSLLMIDEAHLVPHSESGMYRALHRALNYPRLVGGSGTPFRLSGGSLTDGEGAPFDQTAFRYSIIDGIRDGYLVPPFSAPVEDKIDVSKLRVRQGEFTGSSHDEQMLALMDNHIAQMMHFGQSRRSWLVFEASTKAAVAMCERMNQWGIPTGLVLGSKSKAENEQRKRVTEQFRAGQLRAIVNLDCLTTGFDVQEVDMLVCRRRTKSLSLWIQIIGRLLRTIGGNIEASVRAGKCDGLLLDYAGNLDEFGPLDFIRPKETKARLVACEECGTRNAAAAANCWSCDAVMLKNCPACLEAIPKHELDCRHCGYDMRQAAPGERKEQKLRDVPSGAALISSWKSGTERDGGWLPVVKAWGSPGGALIEAAGERYELTGVLAERAGEARWLRVDAGAVIALLCPNGASRTSARQIALDGTEIIVPLPAPK